MTAKPEILQYGTFEASKSPVGPPGKVLLALITLYWFVFLIFQIPIVTMPRVLFMGCGGMVLAIVWIVKLTVWLLGLRNRNSHVRAKVVIVAVAPAVVAGLAMILAGLDLSIRVRLSLARSNMDRLASDVIASPSAPFSNRQVGTFSLSDIEARSGGFVCRVEPSDVHSWGLAFFTPPALPPPDLYCTALGDGWYYWQD